MAFGLDDSDIEDLLESSSSEDDALALTHSLAAPPAIPSLTAISATATREPQQHASGDASRGVPANRSEASRTVSYAQPVDVSQVMPSVSCDLPFAQLLEALESS